MFVFGRYVDRTFAIASTIKKNNTGYSKYCFDCITDKPVIT